MRRRSLREDLLRRSMARIVPVVASSSSVAFSRKLHLGLCSASPRPPCPLLGLGFGELFNLCFLRTLCLRCRGSSIPYCWIRDGVVLLGIEVLFCYFRLFGKRSAPTMNPVFFFFICNFCYAQIFLVNHILRFESSLW